MLHIVNKSPFERTALQSCLQHALAGDAILLIEDAVVGALAGSCVAAELQAALADKSLYALAPDLQARGLAPERLLAGIETVDYAGFVDLSVAHERNQSWL